MQRSAGRPRSPRPVVAAVLLAAVAAGCGSGDGDPPAAGPPPTTQPSASASSATPAPPPPEQQEARQTAEAFLTAVVAGDHDTAYALLADPAQQALSLEDFALAQERKNGSARNLVLYEVTGVEGTGEAVTVNATGRLGDGTPATLVLATRGTPEGRRLEEVPAGI